MSAKYIAALPVLATLVAGHGYISKPQARMPGDAMAAACGQQVYTNQQSDHYGNVQGELQVASSQSDYDAAACDIWLCKGYKFDDNKDNVQTYTAGQEVAFTAEIHAPHTGVANVSIVDTASNSVIGSALKSWDVYASTATGVKDTDTSFSITMPSDLGDQCATAGDCVIQWYWFAEDIDQTYEACVDFTMSGSGSGSSSSGSSSAAASSAASATSKVAVAAAATPSSTLATSAAAATAPATTAASSSSDSQLAQQIAAAFPSSVLTQTLPATATGSASVIPESSLPEGTTVQDLVDWFAELVSSIESSSSKKARRHARDLRA
ncbi:chitin binding protein [Diplodia corticola]|uniref:Chitin binding protein n=1 Tax=Diplodia corticola TaxID=236234 RepID=A0A1J9RGQ3_9PEZI|nr:chitin binding protein [Diplodia corticola]OJD39768.1 chitin binding protein [Diplodia corticola]